MLKFLLTMLRKQCVECGSRQKLAPYRKRGWRVEYVCPQHYYQEFFLKKLKHE